MWLEPPEETRVQILEAFSVYSTQSNTTVAHKDIEAPLSLQMLFPLVHHLVQNHFSSKIIYALWEKVLESLVHKHRQQSKPSILQLGGLKFYVTLSVTSIPLSTTVFPQPPSFELQCLNKMTSLLIYPFYFFRRSASKITCWKTVRLTAFPLIMLAIKWV